MMIEGYGSRAESGSIPLTNGSGSGRPKNMWIRWIRIQIRIRNTGFSFSEEFHSIRTKTKMTFSAMQASRGFLVSGQAQHGFSFLPSGPAPEKETVFQIRIKAGKRVPPKK